MRKKKILFAAMALLVSGMALTACGGEKKADKGSSNELSISAWAYDANPEFKTMVDAFKKENKDVKIKIVDIDADKYEDKITTMLASGDTTDVLAMKGVGSYVNYATKGQLVDLSKEVKALPGQESYKGALDDYVLDDKYYAMPFRKDIYMLFYNKDIFDEMGKEYPKDLTWESYEALSKELTHKVDGKTIYGSYHHVWYPILLSLAANQTGNELLDGKYSYLQDYLDRWIRMQDEGSTLDYSTIKTTGITYASQFETAKTAMMPMGSFYLGKLIAAKEKGTTDVNWGVTTLPQLEVGDDTTYGGPAGFAVNTHSKNKKLAKKFVAFCAGEQGAKVVAGIGMTPAYQSQEILDIISGLDGMPNDEESKKALNPKKIGWEIKPDLTTANISSAINEEYELIMVGDNKVDDGLKEMEKRVKEAKEE